MIDNRNQVCGACGSVNHDPLADYRNGNGILACSYGCYQSQTQPPTFRRAIKRVAYLPVVDGFLDFKADLIELECGHALVYEHDCSNKSLVDAEWECCKQCLHRAMVLGEWKIGNALPVEERDV